MRNQPQSDPAAPQPLTDLDAASGRIGDDYHVSHADRAHFHQHGYVSLPAVLSDDELHVLDAAFDRFTRGEITGMGRDLCDMSATYDQVFAQFALINAMLPRRYLPELQGNRYERLSASIARQLLGADMTLDYDQFLSKKPGAPRAAFAMHQDMGYWPVGTPDTRTATCSLALTDARRANGCIQFVPGSQRAKRLLPHRPRGGADRSQSHVLELELPSETAIVQVEVARGSITVHDEWVVHGSAGNTSDQWRKTYIIAYRSAATVAHERSIGFTHSHNDTVNWRTTLEMLAEG